MTLTCFHRCHPFPQKTVPCQRKTTSPRPHDHHICRPCHNPRRHIRRQHDGFQRLRWHLHPAFQQFLRRLHSPTPPDRPKEHHIRAFQAARHRWLHCQWHLLCIPDCLANHVLLPLLPSYQRPEHELRQSHLGRPDNLRCLILVLQGQEGISGPHHVGGSPLWC